MKKTDRILQVFLGVAIFALGIVIGLTVRHFHRITVSEEINLVDMATLVVTVFLAVYIPAILDRRLQSSKEKQMLLVERVNDYQGLLRRINKLVQNTNKLSVNDHLTIKNLLDICQNKLSILFSLMDHANLEGDFDEDMEKVKKLNDEHRQLLWPEIVIDDDFKYSAATKEEEETLYNKLDEATSMLIFKINDAD